eukprot:1421280-Rhodomonas_salina.1
MKDLNVYALLRGSSRAAPSSSTPPVNPGHVRCLPVRRLAHALRSAARKPRLPRARARVYSIAKLKTSFSLTRARPPQAADSASGTLPLSPPSLSLPPLSLAQTCASQNDLWRVGAVGVLAIAALAP